MSGGPPGTNAGAPTCHESMATTGPSRIAITRLAIRSIFGCVGRPPRRRGRAARSPSRARHRTVRLSRPQVRTTLPEFQPVEPVSNGSPPGAFGRRHVSGGTGAGARRNEDDRGGAEERALKAPARGKPRRRRPLRAGGGWAEAERRPKTNTASRSSPPASHWRPPSRSRPPGAVRRCCAVRRRVLGG